MKELEREPYATVVVKEFLNNIHSARQMLLDWANERAPVTGLREFVSQVWSHSLPRRAQICATTSYEVHGRIGCRIVGPDERVVDVEAFPDGSEAFNVWRVQQFAESVGLAPPSTSDLLQSCRTLASVGVLREVRPDWFAPSEP